MIVTTVDDKPLSHQLSGGEAKVIFASSWGTVFERYDFYLYGSLATIISKQFFSGVNETAGFIFELLAFTAASRSVLSAHCYAERLGDLVGRKYTFLVTIVMMGISTKRRAETHSPNDCTAAVSGSYGRALGR
jgi:MFS family permease